MIKLLATTLIVATGVPGMKAAPHARTILVETQTLHISEDGEMMARRVVQVERTTGPARMVAACHAFPFPDAGSMLPSGPEVDSPEP